MTANNFLSLDYIINHINLSVIIFQYSTKLFKLLQHFLSASNYWPYLFFLNWTIQVYSGSNQWNTFMIILVKRCNYKIFGFQENVKTQNKLGYWTEKRKFLPNSYCETRCQILDLDVIWLILPCVGDFNGSIELHTCRYLKINWKWVT